MFSTIATVVLLMLASGVTLLVPGEAMARSKPTVRDLPFFAPLSYYHIINLNAALPGGGNHSGSSG